MKISVCRMNSRTFSWDKPRPLWLFQAIIAFNGGFYCFIVGLLIKFLIDQAGVDHLSVLGGFSHKLLRLLAAATGIYIVFPLSVEIDTGEEEAFRLRLGFRKSSICAYFVVNELCSGYGAVSYRFRIAEEESVFNVFWSLVSVRLIGAKHSYLTR